MSRTEKYPAQHKYQQSHKEYYNQISTSIFERSEERHIDNILEMYKKLDNDGEPRI